MKNLFNDFVQRIENPEISKIWKTHNGVKKKFFDFFYNDLFQIRNPKIIEFGVRHGVSTSLFLDLCTINDGQLFSIDENDYAHTFNSPKWHFIKSRDDNFEYIKSNIPKKLDVIFIDTLHEALHVNKLIYNYYDLLNVGGYIFIDDISHLPYVRNTEKSNFYCEINNKETFQNILEIYNQNTDCFDLNFSFNSTGLAIIKKKTEIALKPNLKLYSREITIKNLFRKMWFYLKNL